MIKVNLRNTEHNVNELHEMFSYCNNTFGQPTTDDMRWTYGKERDWRGSDMCSGIFEVEWFKFRDEEDRIMFRLRFGL